MFFSPVVSGLALLSALAILGFLDSGGRDQTARRTTRGSGRRPVSFDPEKCGRKVQGRTIQAFIDNGSLESLGAEEREWIEVSPLEANGGVYYMPRFCRDCKDLFCLKP